MPKVILFDADGVTLKRQSEYFSQRFAREHGAPIDEVTNFFKGMYRHCQAGKSDLQEELAILLPQWGWQKSVEEFLKYWFSADVPDQDVLDKVQDFRRQGSTCCLATDQEKYRAQYIREKLGFDGIFDHCFFSSEIGYSKEEPEFFTRVLTALAVSPGEARFWDDDMKNVEAAKSVGIDARFYTGIEDLSKM
jgi:putative hydrolase of the HAD superfamily